MIKLYAPTDVRSWRCKHLVYGRTSWRLRKINDSFGAQCCTTDIPHRQPWFLSFRSSFNRQAAIDNTVYSIILNSDSVSDQSKCYVLLRDTSRKFSAE